MAGTWRDFKGLELLEGVEKIIGTMLLKNELGGISNGYELRHAGANSGYSFGGNQLDLGVNPHARAVLRDIIINARDEAGNLIFEDGGKFYDDNKSRIETRGNPNALSLEEKVLITEAISSDYGRNLLNKDFANEVKKGLAHINNVISTLPNGNIKTTLQNSQELKSYLVDYHNQFNLSINGSMHQFLRGEHVRTFEGTEMQLNNMILAEDIKLFISRTQHGQNFPEDVERRQQNIQETLNEFRVGKYVILNDEDHTFSGTPFDDIIIAGNGNNPLIGGGGTDFLIGGNSNNTITGGPGHNYIYGGSQGNNTLTGGGNGSTVFDVGFSPTNTSFMQTTITDFQPGTDYIYSSNSSLRNVGIQENPAGAIIRYRNQFVILQGVKASDIVRNRDLFFGSQLPPAWPGNASLQQEKSIGNNNWKNRIKETRTNEIAR